MKIARSLIVVSLIVSTSLALAQGGGQGRAVQQSPLNLLARKDVQRDLGLTEVQITKVLAIVEKYRPQRGQNGAGAGPGRGGQMTDEQRAALLEASRKRADEQNAAIAEVLTQAQVNRLGEIEWQIQGAISIRRPNIQKSLNMSDDQIARVREIQAEFQTALVALMQKLQKKELAPEEFQKQMNKRNETLKSDLEKVLNPEQAAKLKALGGTKPFVADPI